MFSFSSTLPGIELSHACKLRDVIRRGATRRMVYPTRHTVVFKYLTNEYLSNGYRLSRSLTHCARRCLFCQSSSLTIGSRSFCNCLKEFVSSQHLLDRTTNYRGTILVLVQRAAAIPRYTSYSQSIVYSHDPLYDRNADQRDITERCARLPIKWSYRFTRIV